MRVIVTGGLGYLGSHVVWQLLHDEHRVVTVDRSLPGLRRPLFPGEDFVHADVLHRPESEIGQLKSADAVIHLAALIDAPQSVQMPELYYKVNFGGTLNMLELAAQLGAKHFLFASSAAVYGPTSSIPLKEDEAILTPENPYGGTKLFGETLISDVCRARGMTYACLRVFNIVGVHEQVKVAPKNKALFGIVADCLWSKKPFTLYGMKHPTEDGTCVRDFVPVYSAAEAFSKALSYLSQADNSVVANVGTGQGTSIRQVLKAAPGFIEIKVEEPREGEVPVSVADVSRAAKILEWTPKPIAIETLLGQEYSFKS